MAVKDCSLSQMLRTSIVKSLFMVCQRHGFLAKPGVVGIMCFFHCPGSNGKNTRSVAKLKMSRIRVFWVFSGLRLCCIFALLSRIRFCCEYALFLICFVQTFTQTLRILLRFCADICSKNWPLRPLVDTLPLKKRFVIQLIWFLLGWQGLIVEIPGQDPQGKCRWSIWRINNTACHHKIDNIQGDFFNWYPLKVLSASR